MGIMREKLLLTIALLAFITLPTMATVTLEETTDAEYMINSGYSQTMAEDIFIQKNRVMGNPIEPLYEKSQNVLVRGWRKFYAYIDPSIEAPDRIHHDIKISPSTTDL